MRGATELRLDFGVVAIEVRRELLSIDWRREGGPSEALSSTSSSTISSYSLTPLSDHPSPARHSIFSSTKKLLSDWQMRQTFLCGIEKFIWIL
jgi:hypothetical protein